MADAVHRLFFALWPDAALRTRLARFAQDIVRQCGGRAIPADNLHMTLAFLGGVESERIAALSEAAEEVCARPFAVVLDRVGFWSRQHLVWASCAVWPAAGGELVEQLQAALKRRGFPVDPRPFVPHVTLVRHARCAPRRIEPSLPWRIAAFRLVESTLQREGSRYECRAEWPLGAATEECGSLRLMAAKSEIDKNPRKSIDGDF